ncbi:hypothetical protein L596_028393 [Steinernema carpocapsae]|uniref:Uncharacterized protein n=1 Tax=Steinernema carpocapsae TaxID=34508 RepID=A0A4U5LYC7_STECR|nr:hypothetical protein L596_028393 [Steinernema carpocapsae]
MEDLLRPLHHHKRLVRGGDGADLNEAATRQLRQDHADLGYCSGRIVARKLLRYDVGEQPSEASFLVIVEHKSWTDGDDSFFYVLIVKFCFHVDNVADTHLRSVGTVGLKEGSMT